jgi:hypothetical protein
MMTVMVATMPPVTVTVGVVPVLGGGGAFGDPRAA